MTEKAKQRDQQEQISEVSLTRSSSRFVGVLRLPRLRTTRFHGGGLPDDRTWREGVLSLKHRRCNETNQYHPTQQSPHENDRLPGNENVHGRTSWDEERLTITDIILRKAQTFRGHLTRVSSLRELIRGSWFAKSGELGIRQNDRSDVREERNDVCILDRRLAGMGAVVPVLEIYIDESVGLIAVQQIHALTDCD